jgi:hypothetical protein
MDIAFDTKLQRKVNACDAINITEKFKFRYRCPLCGNYVRLSAINSIKMIPHFKHFNGNDGAECEKYFKNLPNPDIQMLYDEFKNIDFYFDLRSKIFKLAICFNNEVLEKFQEKNSEFEIKALPDESPFYTLKISRINFYPDKPERIDIHRYADNYYISFSNSDINYKYSLFKNDQKIGSYPIFFKKQVGADSNNLAKLVRGDYLSTDTDYFVVFQKNNFKQLFLDDESKIKVFEDLTTGKIEFNTMGKEFFGYNLEIIHLSKEILDIFKLWGYFLEVSKSLTLLWPPAVYDHDSYLINSNVAFVYSNFPIELKTNTNLDARHITKINKFVTKIALNLDSIISIRNTEINMQKININQIIYDSIGFSTKYQNQYIVEDEYTHLLFNIFGVQYISKYDTIELTPKSHIKSYNSGYHFQSIYPKSQPVLANNDLLEDVLKHFKRTESLSLEDFNILNISNLSEKYIYECIDRGLINSVVKLYLKEGLL